jgi:L-alanine-DL-glutamate epimerase-like enolase superfamily enzyme
MSDNEALHRPIESVEAFVVVVETPSHFSFGVWENRVHAFVRMVSGALEGWSEVMLPVRSAANGQAMDHAAGLLAPLGGLTGLELVNVREFLISRRGRWSPMMVEAADIAATDLCARAQGVSALTYLGLSERSSVPAVYCVLDDNPDRVLEKTRKGVELGFSTHHKVKLFGDRDLDSRIIRAARRATSGDSYLIGDANRGYGYRESGVDAEAVVAALVSHRDNGLSAAEDPAELTLNQWSQVREAIAPLHLIMDRAIRPAWEGIEVVRHGIVDAYNLHPGRIGALEPTVKLARKVRQVGAGLMVGDSSFVGPGCPIWQQLAVGMGADWCEAVEKPWDDDTFADVCTANPIARRGPELSLAEEPVGFGVELNIGTLTESARRHWTLH